MRAEVYRPALEECGTKRRRFELAVGADKVNTSEFRVVQGNRNQSHTCRFKMKYLRNWTVMPHYFFDLRDGNDLAADDEGMELRDIQAVQEEAACPDGHGAG
jgi:hypothetical protein